MKDPIGNIEWIEAEGLRANSYNPNVVFGPELKLLERSILLTGWVQPILVTPERTIIDGFHRWRLSCESTALRKRYAGRCPCVVLPVSRAQAMVMTVRMNRAKGSHVAVRMSALVRALIDEHGLDRQEIADEIGATMAEVELLYQESVFAAKNSKDYSYSKAWYPIETGPLKKKALPRAAS